jgi:glucose uptake protein GlcU
MHCMSTRFILGVISYILILLGTITTYLVDKEGYDIVNKECLHHLQNNKEYAIFSPSTIASAEYVSIYSSLNVS